MAISKKKTSAKKVSSKKAAVSKKTVKTSKKGVSVNKNYFVVGILAIIVILAIVLAVLNVKKSQNGVEKVATIQDLNSKVNAKLKDPEGANNISYGIERDKIANLRYTKEVSNGNKMNFLLKSASASEDNITGLTQEWGIPILMTVICNDDSDIEVTSQVANDNPKIMKAEWYDNDLYYAMTTDNLVTREDFLQEVNRVIINNHIEF